MEKTKYEALYNEYREVGLTLAEFAEAKDLNLGTLRAGFAYYKKSLKNKAQKEKSEIIKLPSQPEKINSVISLHIENCEFNCTAEFKNYESLSNFIRVISNV